MTRQATAEEKRAIEPADEIRKAFHPTNPNEVNDLFCDWFYCQYPWILKDEWEEDRAILEQVRERIAKAREQLRKDRNI